MVTAEIAPPREYVTSKVSILLDAAGASQSDPMMCLKNVVTPRLDKKVHKIKLPSFLLIKFVYQSLTNKQSLTNTQSDFFKSSSYKKVLFEIENNENVVNMIIRSGENFEDFLRLLV